MPEPKCVEHNSVMISKRFDLQGEETVDVYGCPVSGCAIKYAKALGGFGIFNAGKFVLIKRQT
jgi:hypothetical protein